MGYDVVIIHPPAIYDFRKKTIFPGPIAYTVGESTEQFMIPPVGMLSIADYLDRNGYKVLIDNLCERMVNDEHFDAEEHIKNLSARIYAIGLHWCIHSQGALEIAKLCKKLHPDAIILLGGLTATIFHEEILRKYEFVDMVIRGEAEKPFLLLMKELERQRKLEKVPNLTYRDTTGKIRIVPLMEPVVDLDEFEFARLDLLQPRKTIFTPRMPPHWSIPICRGCKYNCVSCGGSAYSCKTYSGRRSLAFRSPEKIAKDIKGLSNQGVQIVFLYQDPRMGGKQYWNQLIRTLRKEKIKLSQLSMELFGPADEEYLKELSEIGVPLSLSLSPESGAEGVRRAQGRNYTNDAIFKTIKICKKYGITLGIHSMIASANDTPETIKETWKFWGNICALNQLTGGKAPATHAFGPMILLDPGSLAFDFPEKYGYRLVFKNIEDYIEGISLPSWHQWISYETRFLNRDSIAKLILDSLDCSINLREKYGLYDRSEAETERLCFVDANKLVINVVNKAMTLQKEDEKLNRLRMLREYLNKNMPHLETI